MAQWSVTMRRWAVWALLGAALTGCDGGGTAYEAAPLTAANGAGTQVAQIYANGDWRDTSIVVAEGQSYRITAEGRWSNGPLCGYTDASGAGAMPLCAGDPWGIGVGGSTLIGRIGPDGRPFGVGKALTLVAPASGHLYLRDYDVFPADNVGFQDVTITRSGGTAASPSLAGAPMPGAASAGLASDVPPAARPASTSTVIVSQSPPPQPSNAQAAVPGGRRVALVVGMGDYRNVPRLSNPPNDARLMAQTLRSVGFELIGGGAQIDLDKPGFDRAIEAFGRRIERADVAVFYFAGHGLQVGGTNWLVPVSANPTRQADLDFQMVDAALVLKQMQAAGTRLNIVVLDACRNNPFGGDRGLRAAGGGLAQMQAPEGTLISYATQPGSVAQDGSGSDSPYTEALAHAIQTPGLDIFRLFNRVGLDVKQQTGGNQLPWVSNSPISGDFYFDPRPGS